MDYGDLETSQETDRRDKRGRVFIYILIGAALAVVALVTYVVLNDDPRSVAQSYQASALVTLRSVAAAEKTFHDAGRRGGGKHEFGDLRELVAAGLVDASLTTATKDNYTFQVEPSKKAPESVWWAVARPVPLRGKMKPTAIYFTNQTGTIWFAPDEPANQALTPNADTGEMPRGVEPIVK